MKLVQACLCATLIEFCDMGPGQAKQFRTKLLVLGTVVISYIVYRYDLMLRCFSFSCPKKPANLHKASSEEGYAVNPEREQKPMYLR